jgi:hypothetical protein
MAELEYGGIVEKMRELDKEFIVREASTSKTSGRRKKAA